VTGKGSASLSMQGQYPAPAGCLAGLARHLHLRLHALHSLTVSTGKQGAGHGLGHGSVGFTAMLPGFDGTAPGASPQVPTPHIVQCVCANKQCRMVICRDVCVRLWLLHSDCPPIPRFLSHPCVRPLCMSCPHFPPLCVSCPPSLPLLT